MGEQLNVPELRQIAKTLIDDAFEHGRFALSPPNVPSQIWKEISLEVANDAGVRAEVRVDPKTDQALTRLNRGFARGLTPFSEEAQAWSANIPGWRQDPRVWHDTQGRGC